MPISNSSQSDKSLDCVALPVPPQKPGALVCPQSGLDCAAAETLSAKVSDKARSIRFI
jgi:hypothetical protein